MTFKTIIPEKKNKSFLQTVQTYKIAAFYLRKVRVCVNNLYSQLYKHNFILTDVEILVVSNLGQLNGSFSNQ